MKLMDLINLIRYSLEYEKENEKTVGDPGFSPKKIERLRQKRSEYLIKISNGKVKKHDI